VHVIGSAPDGSIVEDPMTTRALEPLSAGVPQHDAPVQIRESITSRQTVM
jgi:hypothetical protein